MWLRDPALFSLFCLLAACGEQKLPSPFKAGDVSAKYAQATDVSAKAFGITHQKRPANGGGYTPDHSVGTFLIASDGKPILLAPFGQRVGLLAQGIKLLPALK